MPAPKKIAKRLEGGGRGSLSTGGAGRKAVVKVKPKPNTKAEPRSNVETKYPNKPRNLDINKLKNQAKGEQLKDIKSGKAAAREANAVKTENQTSKVKKRVIKITGK